MAKTRLRAKHAEVILVNHPPKLKRIPYPSNIRAAAKSVTPTTKPTDSQSAKTSAKTCATTSAKLQNRKRPRSTGNAENSKKLEIKRNGKRNLQKRDLPLPLPLFKTTPTPPTMGNKKPMTNSDGASSSSTPNYSGICEDRDFSKGIKLPESRSLYNYIIPEPDSKLDPTPWKLNPAIPPEALVPRILSVVSSVRLGCILDLEKIADTLYDLHYNRDSFTPLKLLLRDPYAVGMVFASGNMVVTGTTSVAENRVACLKLWARIQYCGFPIRKPLIQIQNITSTVDLGFRVRLNDLSKCDLLQGMVYPSENFSGLTVEMAVPRAKIIVFQTGRALITGVTTEADVKEAFHFIYPFAKMYAR